MPDTRPSPSGSQPPARRLLTDASRAGRVPRRLRIVGLGGLAALAVGVALAATPATAKAASIGNLPGCVLPAGVHWQATGTSLYGTPFGNRIFYNWAASANGVYYLGQTAQDLPPDQDSAAGYTATCNSYG